ncbi:MAG: putative DNA binding domain-containing protein [Clostridiales bacterium]|nr:putative DNA binding domain-containing protein [Clostridiales bacterium]
MIPLKIDTLLAGRVVEQNRVEYKEGWNPNDIVRTICAFANDYSNVNGGYLVIGVKEENGIPQFPLAGVPKELLDDIQQEIFQYCNKIVPRYIPKIEVVNYHNSDVYLLYLWCSAGDSGPYQAPVDVYFEKGRKADKRMQYWIRPASLTTSAKTDEVAELFDKFNSVPFDDRVNRRAGIEHIRRAYVEDFLRESNSSLVQEINNLTLEEILVSLEVANETDTDHEIRNIGVLMFADHPEKLIPGAQIDLVWFHNEEAEASDDFTEKTFTGPIWKQIRDALDYIKNNVMVEKVVKIQGEAKAERYFNYPYNALEEALVNAEFHKLYRDPEPVEIRIYVDYIQIINYPGPYRWIDMDKFAAGKVRARKYRNRRIGEFLKDIDLSEKQSTGITKILRELQKNGSPEPEFETDEDRTYLITTIRCREGFAHSRMGESMGESIVEILSEHMSKLEQKRMYVIIEYLHQNEKIKSNTAAELLNVQIKTAGSLLRKAEKFGILTSDGKTKSKVYFLK